MIRSPNGASGAPGDESFSFADMQDAYSAKAFGFRVLWCNRFGQAPERIPAVPDGEIKTLASPPEWISYDHPG